MSERIPHTIETWPVEATRVRGRDWPPREWAAIAWVSAAGVGARVDIMSPRTILSTWADMVAFNWQWSSDGREWHDCAV